jgi:hypothetical protein
MTGRRWSQVSRTVTRVAVVACLLVLVASEASAQTAPQKEIVATVLTPSGGPAANADVAIGLADSRVGIQDGEIYFCPPVFVLRKSDRAGRFTFTPPDDEFWFVIAHESGFAKLDGTSKPANHTIQLERWARVEGVFRIARKLQPNATLQLYHAALGVPKVPTRYTQKTDANGRFVFERVVPGLARINHDFGLSLGASPNGGTRKMASGLVIPVTLIAGETAKVDIGSSGRPVIGQLRHSVEKKDEPPWNLAFVNVVPEDPKKRAKGPAFNASVDPNGNFCIDDVPPGKYALHAHFAERRFGERRPEITDHRFVVPPINEKLSQRPVDLGVLTMTAEN